MTRRCQILRGFSLIELLVVIAIIGVLIATLSTAILSVREAARRTQCANRLRQVGIATHIYHSQNRHFPRGSQNEWSRIGQILPFLEENDIYESFEFQSEPFVPPNDEHTGRVISTLLCTSDPISDRVHASSALTDQQFAHTNFLGTYDSGNATSRGMFGRDIKNRMRDVTDGNSKTLFVGERGVVVVDTVSFGWWAWGGIRDTYLNVAKGCRPGRSGDIASASHWWSHHPNGANFLFVDGAVRFLTYSIDDKAFEALATKDGSDQVDDF